ncbi:ribonuclease H-like domain-containing protein [Mycena maculata]|uniref:Ribonuclease H-like domain-containing protein n=1 Tax=Mycena maculata TaxID=230809 RepID=A0AAD7K3A4_9AGAR|nr:ribonuclease H-like domain-containing protein [Mycena maculata]
MKFLNPIWELFEKDDKMYKDNQTNHIAWCKACMEVCEVELRQEEITAVARGGPVPPAKTQEQWTAAVLASNRIQGICGKIETMKTHVNNCPAIRNSTEKIARRDKVMIRSTATTAAARRSRSVSSQSQQPSSSHHATPGPSYQFPSLPPPSPHFENQSLPFSSSYDLNLSPLGGFNTLRSLSHDDSFSPTSAFAPSPSPSFHEEESRSLKRRRSSYAGQPSPVWTPGKQAEFGEDLCKLFVTCGWSWNAVANPEFKLFFAKYLPAATLPDRHILSGSILTCEADKVIAKTRAKIEGKLATYSEDGWKNVAHTHVDTLMLSVEGQPYLLRTHDMTGRPKTGDELFEIMKSDFEYAWNTYRVEIIAVCTDDGPDGKKAHRLISQWKPSIAVWECWAHQSSLMTGNYLAIKAPWMQDAKHAIKVIKWFNNHGKALDLLRTQQKSIMIVILQLILPVVTRWTAHYCSLRRLKKLERSIRTCVMTHEETLRLCAGRKREQIAAAEVIIETCVRNDFWKNIKRIVTHLEPLAITANILQSPHCRLDTVLLTLANLFRIFSNLAVEDAISVVGDVEFLNAFRDYYDSTGEFSSESMWLGGHAESYKAAKKNIDLIWIWRQMAGNAGTGRSGFVKLAIRVLSMLPNSAGPERAFSVFGITHTKHRNRLDPLKVHDATMVRMDRQKAHGAAGLVKERKSRRFSLADDNETEDTPADGLDAADFDAMAHTLIGLAQNEVSDDDDEQSDQPTLTSPAPPPPTPTAADTVSANGHVPAYKKIKLADLFRYPSPGSPAEEFEFFWQGGRDGLDVEEEGMANPIGEDALTPDLPLNAAYGGQSESMPM